MDGTLVNLDLIKEYLVSKGEYTLLTSDHMKLFAQEWLPEGAPQAVVCLVHGLGEHSSRYSHVAQVLTGAGFVLNTFDLRGHGKSPGQRGHVQSYEALMDDIQLLLDDTARRFPVKPIFLYGHSLGGNLALNFVLRFKPDLAGVIATSPMLRLTFEPPKTKVNLAKVMNRIWPAFSNASGLETAAISRDPEVVQRYEGDPLVHDRISARLFIEMYEAGLWALEHAADLNLPALILHGSEDRLTSAEASRQFAEGAGGYCTLRIWDGGYHELHNDLEKDAVILYLLSWLTHEMTRE